MQWTLGGSVEMLALVNVADDQAKELEQLAREHRGRIFGLCYRYAGNRDDAEDLVQEVFLKAYRGLDRFRGEASVSTWLYRIAVNTCLNWLAARKGRTEPLPEVLVDPGPSPPERLGRSERAEAVRRAVLRLPDRQRMTLVLRVYEELSHKEVAEIMGCPVGTAKANFFFALKNLRKHLEGAQAPEIG